ncbi:MAG: arsenate reductase family protein [Gammaproteobacteria bacterium]|nr:arsenate reductase family protein [Gammaproteobacteria bacterium]
MKLYQYPNCSTCRKAIKYLQDQGVEFDSIDITAQPPTQAELKAMLRCYDGEIRKLFNTSGLQYRELGMKDKLPDMSKAEAIKLLAGNGKLIKRPFIITKSKIGLVGFKPEQWQSLLTD